MLKALEIAITRFSRPGSPVILPTPAYMPFLSVPGFLGREIIQVRMIDDDGFFTFDLDAIEDAFRAGGHLLIFCNPYNPLGRVFTAKEITRLTDVVDRHGGRVFADEIHGPLIYPGQTHIPYAATSPTAAAHTLTATSASKAWNLPGLKCAQVILSSEPDRRRWEEMGFFAAHGALLCSFAKFWHLLTNTDAFLNAGSSPDTPAFFSASRKNAVFERSGRDLSPA